jgi:hypothetical protein
MSLTALTEAAVELVNVRSGGGGCRHHGSSQCYKRVRYKGIIISIVGRGTSCIANPQVLLTVKSCYSPEHPDSHLLRIAQPPVILFDRR